MDQTVDTDYGQFDLVWTEAGGFDGNFDRFFAGQVNGLVGASDPDGVYVNLARRSGGSLLASSSWIHHPWTTMPPGRTL
jgi:hypothetical protein